MPTKPVATKSNDEIFLELAETVGQTIPAQRLFDYKQAHRFNGNPRYWAIVDFNQHSSDKRFYLFDTKADPPEKKIVRYYVSHGNASDPDNDGMADEFSNVAGSHCSSLGIYRCAKGFDSQHHGLALRLDGLEATNSHARDRAIILHKADYVSAQHAQSSLIGRSQGCFAVENSVSQTLVNQLKNGSFIIAWKNQN